VTSAFPPLYECPKCGAHNSFNQPKHQSREVFLDNGSAYYADAGSQSREWLSWSCETCGYEVEGPTNDTPGPAS